MTARSVQGRIDWGHLALLVLLSGIVSWYLYDTWTASSRVRNLILVLPASILALILAVGIASGVVFRGTRGEMTGASEIDPKPLRDRIYPLVLMAIFGLYILTLPVTGFDVGSALFVFVAFLFDGERRPLVLLIYPVIFAAVCTLLFRWLLPYPMITLFL